MILNINYIRYVNIIVFVIFLFVNKSHAQWIKQNSGVTEKLSGVVMLDSATAIVVGENGSILKTTDAGETWEHKEPDIAIATSWNAVSFYNESEGAIVGKYNIIMTTTNAGEGWTMRTPGEQEEEFLSVRYLKSGYIYAGDNLGNVWQSVDSGRTWNSEMLNSLPIRSIFPWRGDYTSGRPLYALTSYSLYSKIDVPSSPWTENSFDYFHGLGSEAFTGEFSPDGGPGFIAGAIGDFVISPVILRRQLSDTSWNPVSMDFWIGALYDLSAPSSDIIYACGTSGMILKTSDSGDSWSTLNTPISQPLNAIYFFNADRGFAVGDSGTILFTDNGGGGITGTDKEPQSLTDKFSLEQNYPNPFNPATNITYSLPKGGFVTLKVYNMKGEEVTTLVNKEMSPGTYNVTWDAHNFPSGVYIYKISAGKNYKVGKMVLVK